MQVQEVDSFHANSSIYHKLHHGVTREGRVLMASGLKTSSVTPLIIVSRQNDLL